jgi:hypothetical protein
MLARDGGRGSATQRKSENWERGVTSKMNAISDPTLPKSEGLITPAKRLE